MKIRNLIASLLLLPLVTFAQTGSSPSAGLTPQSPFYFLDRLGEVLQELIAFSPDAKIRLQIDFAAERIAEIQIEMKAKDVDARGLEVAQSRLERHLSKASDLIFKEKEKGEDVEEWSDILEKEFEASKQALESSFESAQDALEDEIESLEKELEQARRSGNESLVKELTLKLEDLEDEQDELEAQKKDSQDSLENAQEEFDQGENEADDAGEDSDGVDD